MADFCKQCSLELFGTDTRDMAGRVTKEQEMEGFIGIGLCEGCSGGEFDSEGNCQGGCMEESHVRPEDGTE